MASYLIAFAAIAGCAMADDSAHAAYAAPSVSYAPASDYGAPAAEYGAPADAYGAPSDGYGQPAYAPQEYAEPSGYEATYAQEDGGLFDLSKITELLPLFLAVFAAIIVAQLFAAPLAMLFGAKLSLASGILAPLTTAKIDLINLILNPFSLVLGNVGTCTPAGSGPGRSLENDWNMSPDSVLSMIMKANEIYSEFSN